jgi:hypothetical protein
MSPIASAMVVRRGQLLHVARLARQPADRQVVAFGLHPRQAVGRQRRHRVVVDLAARNHRQPLVKQRGERAQDARLRLAAKAEQDEVMARQHGVDQLRHDRVVVADDAGKERLFPAQPLREVLANFVADRTPADVSPRDGRFQVPEGFKTGRRRHIRLL